MAVVGRMFEWLCVTGARGVWWWVCLGTSGEGFGRGARVGGVAAGTGLTTEPTHVFHQQMTSMMDEIDRAYDRLLRNVDNHISRLAALEHEMNQQLRESSHVNYESTSVETETVSDDSESDDDDWLDSEYTAAIELLGIPRVRFGSVHVLEEEEYDTYSIQTVPNNYTPYDHYVDSDDDSDTDTVVLEWEDPCNSPELRIYGRSITRVDT